MGRRAKRSTKRQNKKIAGLILALVVIVLIAIGANPKVINTISEIAGLNITVNETQIQNNTENQIENQIENQNTQVPAGENLVIDYIDVGQADSILITTQDKAMLIDAGNNADGEDVVEFIKAKGITKLDYVIGTHPHEDHIGGMDDVIKSFDIGIIYMPKITTNTKTYEDVITEIGNKNLQISEAKKGDIFSLGNANCEFMADSILDKNNLNLSSIITRITFGNTSFLFMGDAETENEETRTWPKTDVLKVGHHGSDTSSSEEFLKQISPKIAVISVGKDNDYGHPSDETIKKLQNLGATIYRTDELGTIELVSNGNNITKK